MLQGFQSEGIALLEDMSTLLHVSLHSLQPQTYDIEVQSTQNCSQKHASLITRADLARTIASTFTISIGQIEHSFCICSMTCM